MNTVFGKKKKVLIGMIHLLPTMDYEGWVGIEMFLDRAAKDLKALQLGGADAALIENDGDHPCQVLGKPDVVIPMTFVANELSKISKIPLGVEVLLNDPKASLMIAKTCGLKFIRTDYFVDRMERGGYGEFEIDPKGLIKFRDRIDANNINIFADVQVKYARMLENKTLTKSVHDAIQAEASGIIISSTMTGLKPTLDDVREAKVASAGSIPVIIGSGFSVGNAKELMKYADWAIFGNSVKTDGFIDVHKVKKLVKTVGRL